MSERLLDVLDSWDILRHVSVALLATGASVLLESFGVQHLAFRRTRRAASVALVLLALTILAGVTLTLATAFKLNPTSVYRTGICIAWASAVVALMGFERHGWATQRRRANSSEGGARRPRDKRLLLYAAFTLAASLFTWDRVLCGPLLYAIVCSDRALVESVAWGFSYDAPAADPANDYSHFNEQNMVLQSFRRDDATREVVRTLQRTAAPTTRNGRSRVELLFRHLSKYPNDEALRELSRWATLPEASQDVRTAAAKALTSAREVQHSEQRER